MVTLSKHRSDVRIQSSSGSVRAQQRTPGEEAVDEEELEQEERLRTLSEDSNLSRLGAGPHEGSRVLQ